MADEQKESKIKVEDLPQPERGLSKEEQRQVRGGTVSDNSTIEHDLDNRGLAVAPLSIPDGALTRK